MLHPKQLHELFTGAGIDFFVGVPDSLMKGYCDFLHKENIQNHLIAANEGCAVSIAAGYQMSTNKLPLVYFQNSGLGNAVNPITSLISKHVYSIPMILLIGWRGEPNTKDEPQHMFQGRIQNELLEKLEVPFEILPANFEDANRTIELLTKKAFEISGPVALVVQKNMIGPYISGTTVQSKDVVYPLSRKSAIATVIENIEEEDIVISTTGKASRELYSYRDQTTKKYRDFLTVGSMGHASQIALGVSIGSNKKVYCLDGDGAAIMHLGGMSTIGQVAPNNLIHIILNNEAHESVGGQPTGSDNIDFVNLGYSLGYKNVKSVSTSDELISELQLEKVGPVLIEVKINLIVDEDLPRPKSTPKENKNEFIQFINANNR